ETVLGSPPPPPPLNAGTLPTDEDSRKLNVRERLEAHRKNPACAGCHARIDPLGFALEGFDHAGRPRSGSFDAKATLPDGTAINGAAEFRTALLKEGDRFVRQVEERLFVY